MSGRRERVHVCMVGAEHASTTPTWSRGMLAHAACAVRRKDVCVSSQHGRRAAFALRGVRKRARAPTDMQ
eukprot:15433842-Alexandrium_andersonii.AAC.3